MRRFLRILFNLITVLSLVLALAAVAAWLHSTNHIASVVGTRADLPTPPEYRSRSLGAAVMDGQFILTWHRIDVDFRSPATRGESWATVIAGHPALSPPGGWTFAASNDHFDGEPRTWFASPKTLGFGWYSDYRAAIATNAAAERVRSVAVPLLLPLVLALALPVRRAVARWRRARRGEGTMCLTCGYDLRATPARCPECGVVPKGSGSSGFG